MIELVGDERAIEIAKFSIAFADDLSPLRQVRIEHERGRRTAGLARHIGIRDVLGQLEVDRGENDDRQQNFADVQKGHYTRGHWLPRRIGQTRLPRP